MGLIFCVLLIGLTALRGGVSLEVDDCGSAVGSFTNVYISSCNSSLPVCTLRRNTDVSVDITFTTREVVQNVTAVVHGVIDGLPVPFPLANPDACHGAGLQCPLHTGASYDYSATFTVKSSYPRIHLKVKWELKTENKDDIICLLIPVQINSTFLGDDESSLNCKVTVSIVGGKYWFKWCCESYSCEEYLNTAKSSEDKELKIAEILAGFQTDLKFLETGKLNTNSVLQLKCLIEIMNMEQKDWVKSSNILKIVNVY